MSSAKRVGVVVLAGGGDMDFFVVSEDVMTWIMSEDMPGKIDGKRFWVPTDLPEALSGIEEAVCAATFWNDKANISYSAALFRSSTLTEILKWLVEGNYEIVNEYLGTLC